MWYIGKYNPSNKCRILFIISLTVSLFTVHYNINFSRILSQFRTNLSSKNNQSTISRNHYLRVKLDLTLDTTICRVNDSLIIYILSTVTNFQRRKLIRSTWASPLNGTCFVFFLGKIKNSNSVDLLVHNEKQQYNDIVQIDHIESYRNVIYKEIAALQWSYHFYPFIPYLFKTDDDLIIDSILISSIVKLLMTNVTRSVSYISKYRPKLVENLLLTDRSKFFRGGWSMNYQPTLRDGKFGVSKDVWPHRILPLYCSGFGWFMSKTIRNRLANASYTYPVNKTAWIGDVFISGFLAKAANVQCKHISIDYEQTSSGNCSCLMIQRPMLTVCSSTFHTGSRKNESTKYNEYRRAWKVIQHRHNLISNISTDIKQCK